MTITGVKIIKKAVFKNNKGRVLKLLDKNDRFYKKFGEVYLNEIKKNKTKGWICHKKTSSILKVIIGKVKFNLIDKRQKSKTKSKKMKILLTEQSNKILKIPKGVWFSFQAKNKTSLLVNIIELVHSDKEIIKKEIN